MSKKVIDNYLWKPSDGIELEKAAIATVLSDRNTLVVAGPGAGKTELLAQRADFLLETNKCKYPKKILAISFKKDAAENLKARVEMRCGKELSSRFESKTYDAFAKELLDRFSNGLDEFYRPNKNYKIANSGDIRNAFRFSGVDYKGTDYQFMKVYGSSISNNILPIIKIKDNEILIGVWKTLLKGEKAIGLDSSITFEMISRLSDLIVCNNKYIKIALGKTYKYVFLDEFQDTTNIQYELIKSCFYQTEAIITAVGDSKQKIMRWAGAKEDIFDDFMNKFLAVQHTLIMNHRSAPKLLEIQKVMYKYLNEEEVGLKTNKKWGSNDGEAYLRIFRTHIQEAEIISMEIFNLLQKGVNINEICILVKQQIDEYGKEIINELSKISINARNESLYQDLLKEDIVKLLISFLKIATNTRYPDEWEYVYHVLSDLYGIDGSSQLIHKNEFILMLKNLIESLSIGMEKNSKEDFYTLINSLIAHITHEKISSKFQQYQSTQYFDEIVDEFINLLWKEYEIVNNWLEAINNFEGRNSVSIMTIHKSKGLEFDTVFFVGLEDSAFWNFDKQRDEDMCAFFVALSRAKRRIDFTFSMERPGRFTNFQKREKIKELYEILETSEIVKKIDYSKRYGNTF